MILSQDLSYTVALKNPKLKIQFKVVLGWQCPLMTRKSINRKVSGETHVKPRPQRISTQNGQGP